MCRPFFDSVSIYQAVGGTDQCFKTGRIRQTWGTIETIDEFKGSVKIFLLMSGIADFGVGSMGT